MTAARILLAPMEGLLDHSLRDVITQVGGIDRCVSEFIRITDQLLPARVFTRIVPELLNGRLHRRRRAGAAAAAGQRPRLPGRQRGAAGHAGARGHRPELWLPGQDREPPPRRRGAAGRARAGVPHRARRAPRGAGARAGVGQDAAGHARPCRACWPMRRPSYDGGADELVVHARTKDFTATARPPIGNTSHEIRQARAACRWWPMARCGPRPMRERCLAGQRLQHAIMLGRGIVADPGLALAAAPAALVPGWPALRPLAAASIGSGWRCTWSRDTGRGG